MGKRVKRWCLALVVLVLSVLLFAWLTYRPVPAPATLPVSKHFTDTANTTLGRAVNAVAAQHSGMTGIYLLADGRDAFTTRMAMADVAERSIDVQYYIWHNDITGHMLLQALRRAADRGVRVRLLLDDNNTRGLDPALMALDAHPNIEVRLFNPLMHRSVRMLNFLNDFSRANRRMHNKSFTVDNQATVVGGRNVGDEYFGAGDGVMFADLDAIAVGAVVEHVSTDFDRYWASGSVRPIAQIVKGSGPPESTDTAINTDLSAQAYLQALERSDMTRRLRTGDIPMAWSPARLVSDDPAKGLGKALEPNTVIGQLDHVVMDAKQQVVIISPYFVPTKKGTKILTDIAKRGVPVTVLTNALSATDVSAVHAGYAKYRKDLLRAGVKLYELKSTATVVSSGRGGISGSSGASLHAKTFEVDGRQLFVGSFNMDPRSAALNTEMGVLIDNPALAKLLPEALATDGPSNSYAVTLQGDDLRWTTKEGNKTLQYDGEPETTWMQRTIVRVLSWLPIEGML